MKRELLSRWGMEKTVEMNKKQEQLYEEYRLIQYDIVSGKQYSLENQFLVKNTRNIRVFLDFYFKVLR